MHVDSLHAVSFDYAKGNVTIRPPWLRSHNNDGKRATNRSLIISLPKAGAIAKVNLRKGGGGVRTGLMMSAGVTARCVNNKTQGRARWEMMSSCAVKEDSASERWRQTGGQNWFLISGGSRWSPTGVLYGERAAVRKTEKLQAGTTSARQQELMIPRSLPLPPSFLHVLSLLAPGLC